MSNTGLFVRPLSACIGAEILDTDLSRGVPEAQFEAIHKAFLANIVLLFRDQHLTQEQLVAFTRRFGTPGKASHPGHLDPGGAARMHPNLMMVSNMQEDGKFIGMLPTGEMHFHHDKIHSEFPDKATLLYSVKVPSRGGHTLFSNGYAAYSALRPELREMLEGRLAFHVYDAGAMTRDGKGLGSVRERMHPVFRTHEETKMKALYVNRLMTRSICGLTHDESTKVLEELFSVMERPEFIYRHVWRPGDLLLWDNRCSAHARTDFPDGEERLLWRATVLSDVRPF